MDGVKNLSVFKAVGIIEGLVTLSTNKTDKEQYDYILIDGIEFRLFSIPTAKGHWARQALSKQIKNNGSKQKLLVYPKVLHVPQRDVDHKTGFYIVGFQKGETSTDSNTLWQSLKPNEFLLSGLFQKIPVCRFPVLTVFKNYNSERLEFIKNATPVVRAGFMRPSHIPVQYYDSAVEVYRHNKDLEKQATKYFLEIKAVFNPRRNFFVFDSLIDVPRENPPEHLHVSKIDKQRAFAFKQKMKSANTPPSTTPNKVISPIKAKITTEKVRNPLTTEAIKNSAIPPVKLKKKN